MHPIGILESMDLHPATSPHIIPKQHVALSKNIKRKTYKNYPEALFNLIRVTLLND